MVIGNGFKVMRIVVGEDTDDAPVPTAEGKKHGPLRNWVERRGRRAGIIECASAKTLRVTSPLAAAGLADRLWSWDANRVRYE